MRNLFLFIWNNQFTFLFLVLELLGFYLLGTNSDHQRSKINEFSVATAGYIYELQFGYTQYIGLRDENEKLRLENARLQSMRLNPKSRSDTTVFGFKCVPTKAIASSYNREKNFIIVNSGSLQSIERESGVVGPEGIVGIVHSVSENFASILPLLHSDSKISGRLKGKDYFGQCRWRGIDDHYVILENIPNHVSIAKGDTVITRGSRGIFPAGLIIGFAESSERDESSGFQEIKVKLATDFQKLNSLYIIVNQEKLELDSFLTKTVEWTD